MGAIPADFRNTADANGFRDAAAKVAGNFGLTSTSLDLTAQQGFPLAPQQPAADGLVELDACSDLASISGGFFLRTDLDKAAAPNPESLAGQSCDAALAASGTTFAGLMQGLTSQAANLGHLALTADACTSLKNTPRQQPWSALGYWFQPATSLMPANVWHVPTALFEGGSDGQHLALRSEVDTAATSTTADGVVHHTAQWVGVGAYVNMTNDIVTSERGEVLALRDDSGKTRTRDDALTRDTTVTYQTGANPTVDESTSYHLFKGSAPQVDWTVVMHAEPATSGGLNVDLTVTQANSAQSSVKLLLAPGANGACVATAR
jgi:hypothetical protein